MMQGWADHLDLLQQQAAAGPTVVPLRRAVA